MRTTLALGALLMGAVSLRAYDALHAVWDSLLQRYVWAGRIDVVGLSADERLDRYLQQLATAQPEQWPREAQMAFWLNAYNACGVALLVRRLGLRYIAHLDSLLQADTFCIAGEEHTLFSLRQRLRSFGEPLLHFGAGGLTPSFPPLARRAFTSANLRRQLRENARAFLRSPHGCVLDVATNTLWLSPFLAWYRADFERGQRTLLHTVAEFAEPTVAAYIAARRQELRVDFLDFNPHTVVRFASVHIPRLKPLQTRSPAKSPSKAR